MNARMLHAYTWMQVRLGALRHREDGGVAAEYGILLALIAVVIIVAAIALGAAVNTKLQEATDGLNGVAGGT
ncbi:MAG TPA: Flp family type IVb pilin [Actinomycetota bacterium]|nr:Flp family type IVb pilin [Actinomycetota bacterium]